MQKQQEKCCDYRSKFQQNTLDYTIITQLTINYSSKGQQPISNICCLKLSLRLIKIKDRYILIEKSTYLLFNMAVINSIELAVQLAHDQSSNSCT